MALNMHKLNILGGANMVEISSLNSAEIASRKAMDKVFSCIENKKNFVLEAGAGAGKTYSLIQTLKYLIKTREREMLGKYQSIACITYTNVARDEIDSRTDSHPLVFSTTIHSFCWSLIKNFQPKLREALSKIKSWESRLSQIKDIGNYHIEYKTGYPRIEKDHISLGHNDVISLTIYLLEYEKLRKLLSIRFPIIFIDEYQDSATRC